MELCLALDRRNSAYLLENSRSPSCLLRSRPAESSCLKPPKATFLITFNSAGSGLFFTHTDYTLFCFLHPFKFLSGAVQMLWTCEDVCGCLVWTHLSLASRSASAGFSHGASTCLTRDRKRSTSSSSLRTLPQKRKHLYSEEVNFGVDGLVYLTGSDESEQTRAASRVTRTDSIMRMTMTKSF